MIYAKSLICLLVVVYCNCSMISKNQTMQANQTVKYLEVIDIAIPSSNEQSLTIINVQFQLANEHVYKENSTNVRINQYVMCVATLSNSEIFENLQNLKHTFFYGRSPKQFQQIDLNGLSMGKNQYINLKYEGTQKSVKVKIGVKYFGPPFAKQQLDFSVSVGVSKQKKCAPILNGSNSNVNSGSFHCEPALCEHLFSGYDCSNRKEIINPQQLFKTTLSQFQRISLVIPIASAFPQALSSRRLQQPQIGIKNSDTNQMSSQLVIKQTNTIILQILVKSSDCSIYFQQSCDEEPTANPFNANLQLNTIDNNSIGNPRLYSFTLTGNNSQYLSVTFEKYTSGTAQIGVYFRDFKDSFLMASIVVLSSMLALCGFTVFMIWSFARLRVLQRGINQIHITVIPRRIKLPQQSIQKYFPQIKYANFLDLKHQIDQQIDNMNLQKRHSFKAQENVLKQQKESRQQGKDLISQTKRSTLCESQGQIVKNEDYMDPIKQQANRSTFLGKLNDESQCSICIVKIQRYQGISITYCGHIFHSECLYKWFENQTNCPYCRNQFTSQNIQRLYSRVAGDAILTGNQLSMAIYKNRVLTQSKTKH